MIAGVEPKDFINLNFKRFEDLLCELNIQPDYFVRTSSQEHFASVQYFLSQLASEDTYVDFYKGLYCQGCEDFYTERDLINGLCPDHKKPPLEFSEKNIFFRLSKHQEQIFELIESDKINICPASKKKEILSFIRLGLEDFSLSRSSERSLGWGVPYPGHEDQIVYVWIDALCNYLSGIGYGRNDQWKNIWNENTFKIHVIGKNVWKFHAVYWIGLLLSAQLPVPNQIVIHGFLNTEGEKISKSLGNAVDPLEVIQKYGVDAVRFYLLGILSTTEDADFVEGNLLASYNSELANKLGNLASRLFALRNKLKPSFELVTRAEIELKIEPKIKLTASGEANLVSLAFEIIGKLNAEINDLRPWELIQQKENDLELRKYLQQWFSQLLEVAENLAPVIPHGSVRLKSLIQNLQTSGQLYPRKAWRLLRKQTQAGVNSAYLNVQSSKKSPGLKAWAFQKC